MKAILSLLLLTGLLVSESRAWSKLRSGGIVPGKSLGQVWPLPQEITQQETVVSLDSENFEFVYEGIGCTIIDSAISRYQTITFNPPRYGGERDLKYLMDMQMVRATVPSITITLVGNRCETTPYFGMDEGYVLKVDTPDVPGGASLTSNSTWGILRGLETFSQLVYHDDARNFYANSTEVNDYPRFPFRGFMLDTSRHYLSTSILKQQLDAMAYNKFNVFHWHVTDDQSFPYQSQQFPELSEAGAFDPETHIYTFNDISSIIKYAADRGIRVIPEFDTPGHTESWGLGLPQILTECYNSQGPTGQLGPINPTQNSTYEFLRQFFSEAAKIFPDQYFHLGGDEVDFSCWSSNPQIADWMQQMGMGTDYALLETYYMNQLINIVSNMADSKDYLVWQEVFDNGGDLNANTVVNVWKDGYEPEMSAVTAAGFKAVLSSCWYLNYIAYGNDWVDFYKCDPLSFSGTQEQYDLVQGGSGCMWGEYVDATNLIARTWPRASAVAERLWSAESVTSTSDATPRMEEHRCRMLERGINAEPPSGPNYCASDYEVV